MTLIIWHIFLYEVFQAIISLFSRNRMISCVNPLCGFSFTKKTKPEFCPTCNVFLGGTYVAKDKTKKLVNVDGDIVPVGSGIFSVRYHQDFR